MASVQIFLCATVCLNNMYLKRSAINKYFIMCYTYQQRLSERDRAIIGVK